MKYSGLQSSIEIQLTKYNYLKNEIFMIAEFSRKSNN